MRRLLFIISIFVIAGCAGNKAPELVTNENAALNSEETIMLSQTDLTNEKLKDYSLLSCMYNDPYFPTFLVDKCKNILLELCSNIENENPEDLQQLYKLTHAATEKINDLEDEFYENGSEIETGARECFAENFDFIAKAYGFDADVEELIAPRNW